MLPHLLNTVKLVAVDDRRPVSIADHDALMNTPRRVRRALEDVHHALRVLAGAAPSRRATIVQRVGYRTEAGCICIRVEHLADHSDFVLVDYLRRSPVRVKQSLVPERRFAVRPTSIRVGLWSSFGMFACLAGLVRCHRTEQVVGKFVGRLTDVVGRALGRDHCVRRPEQFRQLGRFDGIACRPGLFPPRERRYHRRRSGRGPSANSVTCPL